MTHNFPKIVNDFFKKDFTHLVSNFKTFDIETLPWLQLNKKFLFCKELLDTVLKKVKPSFRYGGEIVDQIETKLNSQQQKLQTYDILVPENREEWKKHKFDNDTDLINNQKFKIVDELKDCKEISHLLKFLPLKKIYNIYINELKPGGFLLPHIDKNYGKWKAGLRDQIVIPLNECDGADFRLYGCGDIPTTVGMPIMINTYRYIHSVRNNSNTSRYHLKIHGDINHEPMMAIIKESFNISNDKSTTI